MTKIMGISVNSAVQVLGYRMLQSACHALLEPSQTQRVIQKCAKKILACALLEMNLNNVAILIAICLYFP